MSLFREKNSAAYGFAVIFLLNCAVIFSAPRDSFAKQVTVMDSLHRPVVIKTTGAMKPQEIFAALGFQLQNPATNLSLEQLSKQILRLLSIEGFLFARIDSLAIQPLPDERIFVEIDEGPRLKLAGVILDAPDSLKSFAALRKLAQANSLERLQKSAAEVLDALGESGRLFAKIELQAVVLDSLADAPTSYKLGVKLVPGKIVYADSVQILGNDQTRRSLILRELGLRQGAVLKESFLTAVPDRLMKTGLFRRVYRPELLISPRQDAILQIKVEEANQNTFNGVIGFNPATETEPGFISGLFDVDFGNLFGTGRKLSARWEKRGRNTQDLAVEYFEPRVLNLPLNLSGGFEQLFQDTLYTDRKWRLQAEFPLTPQMHIVGNLERASISPDTASVGVVPGSQATAFGFGLRYNSANDPINPRSGAVFFSLLERISKTETVIGDPEQDAFEQQRLVADTEGYLPVRGNSVLAVGLHWRQLISRRAINPITDVFRFGGARTLRGYREEQFNGSRIAWANIELRYLLSARSRAFVFFDQGYFYRKIDQTVTQDFKRSFGFGARIETGLGIIGVDYALGEGDGLSQGKVHVSLVNGF